MKSYSTLCLLVLSSSVFACEKIDYVEVKDWPVEKVEKALCDSKEESLKLTMLGVRSTDTITGRSPYDASIHLCDAQAALYTRVIENVHKRKVPNCKYK